MNFKELFSIINSDLETYLTGKNSILKKIIVFFTNPGFQLLTNYRVSHYLKETPFSSLNILIRYLNNWFMSSEISPYAKIGKNIQFAHPNGIVIGYGTVIKDNVTIFQQVTLGAQGGSQSSDKKYPIIGNNVIIYTKASVIGGVYVGNNCIVGAHSLVLNSTDDNGVYVGIPAKKVTNV